MKKKATKAVTRIRIAMSAYVERPDGRRAPLPSGAELPGLYRKGFVRLVQETHRVPSGKLHRRVTTCLACGGVTYAY